MWESSSIYPRIETGYAFTKDMNDDLVEKINNGKYNQYSIISRIRIKIIYIFVRILY